MEQAKPKKQPPLPEIRGRVCNRLLLCRKYEIEEKTAGGIFLKTEDGGIDVRDKVQKKAEIILSSEKLSNEEEDFKTGQIVTYPNGTREMAIWIDEESYFLIHKSDVVYVQ